MKIKSKFYRWLAKSRLIKRYDYLTEVNKLMEEYTTDLIIQGGSEEYIAHQRKALLKLQNEIKGTVTMLTFLKGL